MTLLSKGTIFHFHDHGRKGTLLLEKVRVLDVIPVRFKEDSVDFFSLHFQAMIYMFRVTYLGDTEVMQ